MCHHMSHTTPLHHLTRLPADTSSSQQIPFPHQDLPATVLMPPHPSLTFAQYMSHALLPVVHASATNTCYICKEIYTEEHGRQPVILPKCGHIFCYTCITAWFESGQHNANTCPLDRSVLFRAESAESGERADWDVDSEHDSNAHVAEAIAWRRPGVPVEEVFVGSSAVARAEVLTYAGCQLVISDLWHYTARLLCVTEGFSGPVNEPWDMDVEILRGCIQNAIPRGVRCGEDEWAVLYECARQMLVWHSERGLVEGTVAEECRNMGDELFEVSGGDL